MNVLNKIISKFNIKLQWSYDITDHCLLLQSNRKLNLFNFEELGLFYILKAHGLIENVDQNVIEIDYFDLYKFYYRQDENNPDQLNQNIVIDDYVNFELPPLYESHLNIENEGNYLIDNTVTYSYKFEADNYLRIGKSPFLLDRNASDPRRPYCLMPLQMFRLIKELDLYNSNKEAVQNPADQFAILAKIKDYEKIVSLTLNSRLQQEPKPIIIDKLKIELMDNGNELNIAPRFSEDNYTDSQLKQNCYLSPKIKDFYSPQEGPLKGVKFVVRPKEILEKIRNECTNLKNEDRLKVLQEKELFFADWDEDIENKIDFSLYSERVVGIGYLNYKKGLSFTSSNNLNWSESGEYFELPCLMAGDKKTTLNPEEHLSYFDELINQAEKQCKNQIELDLTGDSGEKYKTILSREDLEYEKSKLENSIVSPEDISSIEVIEEILSSYNENENKKYIPLISRGVYVSNIDGKERLENQLNKLIEKKEANKLLREEKSQSDKLSLIIKENEDELEYSEVTKKDIEKIEKVSVEIPSSIKSEYTLMDHQKDTLKRLQHIWKYKKNTKGFMLCDDMGLGKTLQLLSFFAWLKEKNSENFKQILIVAPAILLKTWEEEINKFFKSGTFKTFVLDRRLNDTALLDGFDIVLMTYSRLRIDSVKLGKIKWSVFVCDEAQFIKEPKTLVTVAAKAQQADLKIVCTATPIENSMKDLWNLVDFCTPGLMGSLKEFKKSYIDPLNEGADESKSKINEKIKKTLDPIFLRREKDLLKKLPKKNIVVYKINASKKEIDCIQKYYRMGKIELGQIKNMIWTCAYPDYNNGAKQKTESSKLKVLKKILDKIKAKNEKVVIFIESIEIQKIVSLFIHQNFSISVDIINGSSKENRANILNRFKISHGFNAIILSPLAAGFGITVTEANHVIHYTRMWNPAKEDQATDRVYRIGQTKDVFVHLPILSFDHDEEIIYSDIKDLVKASETHTSGRLSPEEKLHILLARKKRMLLDFFFAGSQSAFANVTVNEFINLGNNQY